jgi:ribosomal protein S18 acetylase RimI-like enzyme
VNFRRLEEIALNASGPPNPRFFDGWVLGFTPGKSKRVRSINPFYGSTLPLEAKVDACRQLYAAAGLPCIVRLTPFVQPPELEEWLITQGYERFDDTLVMARSLEDWDAAGASHVAGTPRCVEHDLFEWTVETQDVRSLSDDQVRRALDRQEMLRLDGVGMLMRKHGKVVAWGMTQIEDGWAGLYNIETCEEFRRSGMARQLVSALLSWAHRHRAGAAYLQVTEANAAAIPLYVDLGFTEAYRYWYRALPEVVADERR